jgi:SAM-dependent methyltransferase
MSEALHCWCGNADLQPFSSVYKQCSRCETLVSIRIPDADFAAVTKDESGFYGKEYWFGHQEKDLGFPNIIARSRSDLSERCLYWLRTLLKYKAPPGRALELGGSHGGFVALLQRAGFHATGLELSPWVVEFARETFAVPMLLGPVEEQQIAPASLDVIVLMDVLEHLVDPVKTIRHCLNLLTPDGVFVIQTPHYEVEKTYEQMLAQQDDFLEQLKDDEHLYLFSQQAVCEFFKRLGVEHVVFEPAFFAQYDMFLVASRVPLAPLAYAEVEKALSASPDGRLVQALLDVDERHRTLLDRHSAAQKDRAAHLAVIEQQGQRLQTFEESHRGVQTQIQTLQQKIAASEADRTTRLTVIEQQGRRLQEFERDGRELREQIATLHELLAESQADRAARLTVIEEQGRRLQEFQQTSGKLQEELSALRQSSAAAEVNRATHQREAQEAQYALAQSAVEQAGLVRQIQQLEEKFVAAEEKRRALMRETEQLHARLNDVDATFQILQSTQSYRLLQKLRWWRSFDQSLRNVLKQRVDAEERKDST